MQIIIHEIKEALDVSGEDLISSLKSKAAKRVGINSGDIKCLKLAKKSVDARKKSDVFFVYSVVIEIDKAICLDGISKASKFDINEQEQLKQGTEKLNGRVFIVGSGPAGLFAALTLAETGYRPIVIERGATVEKRVQIVNDFWNKISFSTETNVQFGEGGAGTFSDGKLTTRINDVRCSNVLSAFVKAGASENILFEAKPHLGTDELREIIPNIREKIISLGGEFLFETCLNDIEIKNNILNKVKLNDDWHEVGCVVLAIGHSARDTYEMLYKNGVTFAQKPFSVGARVEHLQQAINECQYGKFAGHPALGAADYKLFTKDADRTAYSFCMCPGGVVVASASEKDSIVTNGMSYAARNSENANSAIVASVEPNDFGSSHPLAGIEFQREIEKRAFLATQSQYVAPIQTVGEFVFGDTKYRKVGSVKPSYTGETKLCDLNEVLPSFVANTLKDGFKKFSNSISAFGAKDAILTGVETRTSAPVRILRDVTMQAINTHNLYPAGEGAGYAGGIMSAAVDGIKVAEMIIKRFYV